MMSTVIKSKYAFLHKNAFFIIPPSTLELKKTLALTVSLGDRIFLKMKYMSPNPFVKETVSRDFLILFFFINQCPPQPLSIPLGPFGFFLKIRGDIPKSRCTTGIDDTSGKFFHQFR